MKSRLSQIIGIFITAAILVTAAISITYSNQTWADNVSDAEAKHPDIYKKWHSSHHQKAMLRATEETVLGDFQDIEIEINGVKSSFFTSDGEYRVLTNDVGGTATEFKIEYVFGFEPLQQYLVKTDNGKYQVLPFSWDSRPADRGGQRWFHIYGDDHIAFDDRLHWTQPLQNWNGMCADCHSTGLKRAYDIDSDSFDTSWQSINVSCGSCHTAKDYDDFNYAVPDAGWSFEEGMVTAKWSGKRRPDTEIEVCAACHSRRSPITDGFNPEGKFLDHFSPTLIQTPEYYPDGQVKEEDYVWGSFLQSKMFSNGVICSDCHDPHSLELKLPGNQLCAQCHLPEHFDTPNHHNHIAGTEAAQCVTCHMPETTFMQVDARNDHSFRVPRPDLAYKTGSPDVCTSCHDDISPTNAADIINSWNIGTDKSQVHYAEIFNDVLSGKSGAEENLKRLVHDTNIPSIIRASGYQMLSNYPNADTVAHIAKGLKSSDPLIRLGALRATDFIPLRQKQSMLEPLLNDEFKVIRVEAYGQIGNDKITSTAKQEYITSVEQGMWRGEGRYNLALFHHRNGNINQAIEGYLGTQKIDPYFPASYVNLADLFRSQNDENSTRMILDRGLSLLPQDPDINFSKALQLVRAKKPIEALENLEIAVNNAPKNTRYAYVYGIALRDLGQIAKAKAILIGAHTQNKEDPNINFLLLEIYRSEGNWNEALKYAENLSKLLPKNSNIRNILADIKTKQGIVSE